MHEERPIRADAARNRRAILDTTAAMLAEFGYEHVTMDRVAAAAGVGKGTIFHRFGNRAGLLQALALEDAEKIRAAVTSGPPPLGPGASPTERLVAFFDAMASDVVANIELVAANASTDTDREAEPLQAFWHQHVSTLLTEIHPSADTDMLATLLLNALSGPPIVQVVRDGQSARYLNSVHALITRMVSS